MPLSEASSPTRLLILGSTGSIGTQALEVCARSDEFELVGLSAERSWEALVEQARAHRVERIALADAHMAARAAEAWTEGEVLSGAEGLVRLVVDAGADLVLNALVGSAGLGPTVATLHQLIAGQPPGSVQRLTITASGGPFRGRSRDELRDVTIAQALAHPTWEMGGKITIDSATLMNKGLEVMEAHHLFHVSYERIDVVIHPQSLVHGLIELADGAMLAHIGPPDMRIAISYALNRGESAPLDVAPLDLAAVGELNFCEVDRDAYPCLRLARDAAVAGGTAPCTLNAANEVAVHAFLGGRLGFLDIPEVIERTLSDMGARAVSGFESLYEADREARELAAEVAGALR